MSPPFTLSTCFCLNIPTQCIGIPSFPALPYDRRRWRELFRLGREQRKPRRPVTRVHCRAGVHLARYVEPHQTVEDEFQAVEWIF